MTHVSVEALRGRSGLWVHLWLAWDVDANLGHNLRLEVKVGLVVTESRLHVGHVSLVVRLEASLEVWAQSLHTKVVFRKCR